MRKARILYKDEEAGVLTQHDDGSFTFSYHDAWLTDNSKPAISLTMPKDERAFSSNFLFSFFFNMLPEGSNKQVVCKHNRLDPADDFGLLLTAARYDSIGAVRVIKLEQ
jgi:serine/threonine-protein kinase HipA